MITIEDLLVKQNTNSQAANIIKEYYNWHCVFSEQCSKEKGHDDEKITIDGCHILDAGIPRFKELVMVPLNYIPAIPRIHTGKSGTLDIVTFPNNKRKPADKIDYIVRNASYKFKDIVEEQIWELKQLCEDKGIRI